MLMGCIPTFHLLAEGWLGFLLHSKEDASMILRGLCFMDRAFLSMKSWHPLFDTKDKYLKANTVWVKLSSLSMELWTMEDLKSISGLIGKTLFVDDSFRKRFVRHVTRMLVKVDVNKGLFEFVELVWAS